MFKINNKRIVIPTWEVEMCAICFYYFLSFAIIFQELLHKQTQKIPLVRFVLFMKFFFSDVERLKKQTIIQYLILSFLGKH